MPLDVELTSLIQRFFVNKPPYSKVSTIICLHVTYLFQFYAETQLMKPDFGGFFENQKQLSLKPTKNTCSSLRTKNWC